MLMVRWESWDRLIDHRSASECWETTLKLNSSATFHKSTHLPPPLPPPHTPQAKSLGFFFFQINSMLTVFTCKLLSEQRSLLCMGSHQEESRGRYHGGRRPSSDDSFHSPTVILPSALDKPSIVKRYHRRRTCSLISSFADDGNASWYSVCRVPMVEWRLDCENCRQLTVVGLRDTGPRFKHGFVAACWTQGRRGEGTGMQSGGSGCRGLAATVRYRCSFRDSKGGMPDVLPPSTHRRETSRTALEADALWSHRQGESGLDSKGNQDWTARGIRTG